MVYVNVVICVYVFLISLFTKNNIFKNRFVIGTLELFLFVILTITIGFRDLPSFPDNVSYKYFFESSLQTNLSDYISMSPMESGFSTLTWMIGKFTDSYTIYFFIIFLFFLLVFRTFLKEMFNNDRLVILMIFISTPIFISFSANIIRNGLAVSFLLLGTCSLFKERKSVKAIVLLILAMLFHTAVIPLALFAIVEKLTKFRLYTLLFFWVLSIFAFLLKVPSLLVPVFANFEFIQIYTSMNAFELYGGAPYRIDFLLFNTLLVLIIIVICKMVPLKGDSMLIGRYVKLTVFSAIIFNCFGYIAFSDRIAVYVWLHFIICILLLVCRSSHRNIIMPSILLVCMMFIIMTRNFVFFN